VNNELEICGRKWSWPNLGYSDLRGTSEEQKTCHARRSSGRDLNVGSSKYGVAVLLIRE
jgi:hypothetical protein